MSGGFSIADAASSLPELRSLLGRSTALWASAGGRPTVEDGRWLAFSGAPSVDYNVAMCHGPTGGRLLRPTVDAVAAAGVRAVIMVAGEALADVQVLVEAGWVCVGAVPLMALDLNVVQHVPEVRELVGAELPAAREVIADSFALTPELAEVALPDTVLSAPGQQAWGLFEDDEIVSCTGTVTVDDVVVVWSMATPSRLQRRGHGRRLLTGVLAACRQRGAGMSLLHASQVGEPFYLSVGYEVIERWQLWSRPRWVFGRT